jgi:hypothetical protein
MFPSQEKRINEIDYTTELDIKTAVDYINKKNNYNHSDVIEALYNNDVNYLHQNYYNVINEFDNGEYTDVKDFSPVFSAVPDETLKEFRDLLNKQKGKDINSSLDIDDQKEREKNLEMMGYISLQGDLALSIEEVLASREEDKKQLLESMGFKFSYHDGMDPYKKAISEMVEGVEYIVTQNDDGTFIMDVNKKGVNLATVAYDKNGETDYDKTTLHFDRTENLEFPNTLSREQG